MQQATERRQHIHWPALLRCRIEGIAVEGSVLLTGLNEAGCFVFTDEPLALGPRIALQIEIPAVRLTGRVVRVESGRAFGVEINVGALSDESRRLLQDVLLMA